MTDNVLREPAEPFRLLVENSRDILTIRNADGRIRYTNSSYHTVMGYKPEEMVGTTGFDLLHPDDRAAVEQAMAQFWQNPGARGLIRYRCLHAEGYWVHVEVTAYNLLADPEVRGVVLQGRRIYPPDSETKSQEPLLTEIADDSPAAKTLSGILSTCASCKKIKDEKGDWQRFETYIRDRAPVEFSHGICPECAGFWYPEFTTQ
jgi:PAS domain S-box-containing protein